MKKQKKEKLKKEKITDQNTDLNIEKIKTLLYPEKSRLFLKKHRLLIITAIIIGVILFSIFSTQIVLYLNFITGNDIIVKLEVDKQHLTLANKETETISFKESITTNPFCSAQCNYEFIDISHNKIIDKGNFISRPGAPLKKEYNISSNNIGKGQELYRFDLDCVSRATFLCHTSEEPATRSILITNNYDLNQEEKILKKQIKQNLNNLSSRFNKIIKQQTLTDENFILINNIIEININDTETNQLFEKMTIMHDLWEQQNLVELNEQANNIENDFQVIEKQVSSQSRIITDSTNVYNLLIDDIDQLKIKQISDSIILDNTIASQINRTIDYFNKMLIEFPKMSTIKTKIQLVEDYKIKELNIISKMNNEIYTKYNQRNAGYNLLCELTSECMPEIKLELVEDDIVTNISYVCTDLEKLKQKLLEQNRSVETCEPMGMDYVELSTASIEKIKLKNDTDITKSIEFNEPLPKCCVFGQCNQCCTDEECNNNHELYPTIFLHGHSFNKETSAEYSLEGFADMQDKLEQDSYLNAGTVTLFTGYDSPKGAYGLSNVPITIRASYYFDVFKEPENYIVVQTKSENIDTYSIRLKDLIDTVKYMTNKPKINIIAFSMGGLVARRYIQIFGEENINKLILIATPNKGIKGDVTDYCNVLGERLECHDMNSNSLFLNKLNSGSEPSIPVYNIIGTGCRMDFGIGDGVVLEQDAGLDFAENHVIQGKCSRTRPLHTAIKDIETYPEVYDIVLESLKE